jgi:hypothetical protein
MQKYKKSVRQIGFAADAALTFIQDHVTQKEY